MCLADHTMRELVAVFSQPRKYASVPQVDTEPMTDEEFYDWLDADMNDVESDERWDEVEAREVGSRCYGEI